MIPLIKKLYIFFVVLTAVIPIRSVLLGGIPFWYDPGRDLLLAQSNLSKLTLIGPTGGIPGIFYGPYWIWLLSLPMIFTQNPRFIVLLSITLPFLIFFPLLLWKMRTHLSTASVFIIWGLFILNFDSYVTFPWNPHLSVLFFLLLFYLTIKNKSPFLIGVVCGLVPNFSFSFGVTVVFATTIFQLVTGPRKLPKFFAGLALAYLPVIFFELRHNFLQTRTFFSAFINSAFYNTAVVGQMGMPKNEIVPHLQGVLTDILHLPSKFSPVLTILLFCTLLWKGLLKQKTTIFLLLCLSSLLFVYFSTKNPVWPYYFIGVETILLLLIGLIVSKSRLLTAIAFTLVGWLFLNSAARLIKTPVPDFLALPTLASKETNTRFVISDAGQNPFEFYAYSPAIHSHDYNYLFSWLGKKTVRGPGMVYLIIPSGTSGAVREDFIHYKTPDQNYETLWEKTTPDGTIIIKRVKAKTT